MYRSFCSLVTSLVLLMFCSSNLLAAVITQGSLPSDKELATIISKPHSLKEVIREAGFPNFALADEEKNEIYWYYISEEKTTRGGVPNTTNQSSFVILIFDATTELFKSLEDYTIPKKKRRNYYPQRKHIAQVLTKGSLPFLDWQEVSKLSGLEIKKYASKAKEVLILKGALENDQPEQFLPGQEELPQE